MTEPKRSEASTRVGSAHRLGSPCPEPTEPARSTAPPATGAGSEAFKAAPLPALAGAAARPPGSFVPANGAAWSQLQCAGRPGTTGAELPGERPRQGLRLEAAIADLPWASAPASAAAPAALPRQPELVRVQEAAERPARLVSPFDMVRAQKGASAFRGI